MKLLQIAKKRFIEQDGNNVHFVDDVKANILLNDINKYPHFFVLACLMDRGIKAEKAWEIPYKVSVLLKTKTINGFLKYSEKDYQKIFNDNKLHRYNNKMGTVFYNGLKVIKSKYSGNAALIWENNPSSATVVLRFLEFAGSGIKISTMAANILARQYKIKFSDYYSIDISPDIHIQRVMKRMGLVPRNSDLNQIIYKAREINPEFPGIIDFSCWEIGRKWCRPNVPNCESCIINSECKKNL